MDWSALDREMAQMRRLVDQLLSLARQESRAAAHTQETGTVQISRVVREAVADIMLMFEAAGRTIDADIEDALVTPGSGGQLREAVQNSTRKWPAAWTRCGACGIACRGAEPDLSRR